MQETDTPLYIQIQNQIKDEIESGNWSVGTKIPSERDLAEKYSVSRMTLRQAVQTLVDEGVLKRKVGSGTYVASSKVKEKMMGLTSFTELMNEQGRDPSSKTVSFHISEPSMNEKENLQLDKNSSQRVLRMERIRYADNEPICIETTTMPEDIVSGLTKKDITRSLYNSLEEKKGYKIDSSKQIITATVASERVASLLELKRGAAILQLRQSSYLSDGRPFEFVISQYAGERFEFYLERTKK